jgi:hypothetical protein
MFDIKTSLTGRLTDAVDLLIDFATLGEYGLEPVGRTTPSCEAARTRSPKALRGPGCAETRARGLRGASDPTPAGGAA